MKKKEVLNGPIAKYLELEDSLLDKDYALEESGIAAVYSYIVENPDIIDLQKASVNLSKETAVLFTDCGLKFKATPAKGKSGDKFDAYTGYAIVVFKYLLDVCGYELSNSRYERKYQEVLESSYEQTAIEILETLGIDRETFDEVASKKDDILKIELAIESNARRHTMDCDCLGDLEELCSCEEEPCCGPCYDEDFDEDLDDLCLCQDCAAAYEKVLETLHALAEKYPSAELYHGLTEDGNFCVWGEDANPEVEKAIIRELAKLEETLA